MATKAPAQNAVADLESRLEALETATVALAAEPSLDRLLQLIVDLVRPVAGARYAAIGIVTTEGYLERFVTSGISDEVRQAIGPLPRGHGLLGLIVSENRTIRVHDAMVDTRRAGFPAAHPPMHSFLGTPIKVQGRSVGNLYLTEKAGSDDFTDEDVRLVETFARYAGIAIQNARLNAELERLAVVSERERIGHDLHDGIIQSLYAVGLSLEDLGDVMRVQPGLAEAQVERAIDAIHVTIRDLRGFIFGLRPEFLEAGDVRSALAAVVEEFRRGVSAIVTLRLIGDHGVSEDIAVHVLQVAREALSNAARYSSATGISVTLETSDTETVLFIHDNGRGFDSARSAQPGHTGLTNMFERARIIGGHLDVKSSSAGTTVELRVPSGERNPEEESA